MKIVIAAGGTGGHLYPGIAIGRALVGHTVVFVVRRGDLGKEILKKESFVIKEIAGQGMPRSLSLKAFLFPINFLLGMLEAALFLISEKPDWILGMGGYLSVPLVLWGRLLGIRVMLHEQNAYPGLANRWLGRIANSVAVSFPQSQKYFPSHKVWVSGLPVRPEIGQTDQTTGRRNFELDMQTTTYLVFGGSLGAQRLNSLVLEAWELMEKTGQAFQVLHITGKNDFARISQRYRALSVKAKVLPYCHDMASAYAAADAVISRAGASTVAELLVTRKRALLVPYPFASNDHQTHNARVFVETGGGRLIQERDLTGQGIMEFLAESITKGPPARAPESFTGAALRVANHLTSRPS